MKEQEIHQTAVLNSGFRMLQDWVKPKLNNSILSIDDFMDSLPDRIYIGPFAVIGSSCIFSENVVIDEYCSIDPRVSIMENTLVTYRASIGSGSKIGKNCIIGGFIPENCIIENECRVFGKLVHNHIDSTISWDHHSIPEKSPIIRQNSFIGFNAVISGGLEIGPFSYVCASSLITRDVPPYHIAHGENQIVHFNEWKGDLKNNPIFKLKL